MYCVIYSRSLCHTHITCSTCIPTLSTWPASKASKQTGGPREKASKQGTVKTSTHSVCPSVRLSVHSIRPSDDVVFSFSSISRTVVGNSYKTKRAWQSQGVLGKGEGGSWLFVSLFLSLPPGYNSSLPTPSIRLLHLHTYIYIYIYTYARTLKKHSRGARARDEPKQEPGIHAACK
jgi:hypothetical protein